ncbi:MULTISPECIES: mycofactocin-coupled SDR family oxidoreductase [Microcella]|uniref:Mycofactocin-coupled SDR family oxidoreductase n=1 Tax=Microcella pacifica TaxID=2591847 RepID=A0A9E5JKM2_9MICO|nr:MULTISPECIES: mycofactocin-coupled SDR family oxidoreductase [Microcella]MBR22774.1 SDR family mycofactocin-dependent oxidoreductase [Leifsonia sp.]MBU1250474.1 mycofactocin-coupled SDR family oxidoreductase [Actinomycetota bacterium]MBU1610150.1 mycofactocin-coupled SDR family oxidoreductase [Actinomycetota bacterium]MBU2315482.1 mycofactocin-coupled SDR family oxidoreductase [Actinomycetota bacterium]MBU2385283.1 mycofactocin-coupled SDR family oxidoreductase [Actinomycetota bacterium]
MGRLDGKVVLISGVARSQGRSHALRFAEEGADVIGFDVLDEIKGSASGPATQADMDETVRQVEALDRRIIATKADVRDWAGVKAAVDDGVAQLGRLDVVLGNAGVFTAPSLAEDMEDDIFMDTLNINVAGVWRTAKAAIPHLKNNANGGSIIMTSSVAGLSGIANFAHYVASKHALVGLMRTLALELAPSQIRVNTVHPGTVNTVMVMNDVLARVFRPDLENPTADDVIAVAQQMNPMGADMLEPYDISNAMVFLASDEARYITGVTLPVDAGSMVQ